MDNKAVLNKLLKIAENQQKILMKIAQSVDPTGDADNALKALLKNTHSIWAANTGTSSKLAFSMNRAGNEKSYTDCKLILTVRDQKGKSLAEDPGKGLLKMAQDAFAAASQNQASPSIA